MMVVEPGMMKGVNALVHQKSQMNHLFRNLIGLEVEPRSL
jgi:hypothetical protein